MSRTRRTYVVAIAVAAIVTAANASQGAYFSQSWGWVALAFLVPTTVLLILESVSAPGRLRVAFASFTGGLAAWIALSSLWSISAPASLREAERMLVYVAVALAITLVLRQGDAPGVLAGAGLGVLIVCGYALATRLFPDRFDTYDDPIVSYRLAEPLGYWNALGLLATLGLILAIGFVAHARRVGPVLVAAAAAPVLATTLYFTFSRGAWAALGIGLIAAVALDPRRVRLIWCGVVVTVPTVVAVAYASQQDALTTEDAPPFAAAHEGHRVAGVVTIAMGVSALGAWGARALSRRVPVSRSIRRAVDVVLAVAALALVLGALVVAGGPAGAYTKLKHHLNAAPVAEINLNDRLFSISPNGRNETFEVAWRSWRERPLLGFGSGSYEYLWYEQRPSEQVVRDAHSLYLETMAELGVVGLVLLTAFVVVLAVGGLRARRRRLAASGTAAVLAWTAVSAVDWHWEMVGVTLTAVLAGGAGLVASERGAPRHLGGRARAVLIAATAVLSVFAAWSLVGNQALFAARDALAREDWSDARQHGRRAQALLFWSYEPDLVLGDAAAGAGDRESALHAYRDAVATDPRNWVAWLHLAQVARGSERAAAYDRVHELNPREEGVPGE
jgi:O-antigen ligase